MFLVIEFVFEGKEMLVKWDSITKECLITASFVFLVNLSILKQLNLSLH
jgi:hypothetical protein